jgi:hypothetical protein
MCPGREVAEGGGTSKKGHPKEVYETGRNREAHAVFSRKVMQNGCTFGGILDFKLRQDMGQTDQPWICHVRFHNFQVLHQSPDLRCHEIWGQGQFVAGMSLPALVVSKLFNQFLKLFKAFPS